MRFRSRRNISIDQSDIQPIVRLWILRLLIPLECHKRFITSHGLDSDELAIVFDLPVTDEESSKSYNPIAMRAHLKRCYEEAEQTAEDCALPQTLADNIEKLADQVGLNETESWILAFTILIRSNRLLGEVTDWLGSNLNTIKAYHILSVLLNCPEEEIRKALSMQSVLMQTSLVIIRPNQWELNRKLDVISDDFVDHLLAEPGDPVDWLRDMIIPSHSPTLSLSDYPHIQESLDFLVPYLQQTSANRQKGVNIFIHGTPGTGKTQLARVLTQHIERPLYEIASEDSDGDPICGEQRLRAFRAAQAFFKQSPAFMLFDEVEDVFNDGNAFFGKKSTAQTRKAWMNRLLEENPVPTFWLGNSIRSIDPAFIRRFDWVLELPIPPKEQRTKIISNTCGHVLTETAIKRLAACDELAPAVITRAAQVIGSLQNQFPVEQLSNALQQIMDNTLIAQGHPGLGQSNSIHLPDNYDPDLINCDADLKQIAAGIQQHGSARLCLFGPPGTGKTAYCRWLAEQLDKPLHIKRGADLLSKWVGGTEKNIAQIFREAEQDKAILMIDEVDSFLQDRSASQHSWEITGVNEMLTRMETYNGVFIASTNRLEGLDSASIRRFDLKIKFEALKPHQAWQLFNSYCQMFGFPLPQDAMKTALHKLDDLTPGDFAVLARQHRFRPFSDPQAILSALVAECALKTPHKKQPIGFF
jgi:transitional endoplasmic reticulum ATPase